MQLNSCVRALVSISYFRCIWLFNLGFEFRNIWNPSIGYTWMTANFFREASPNLRINNQPISTIGSFNETIEGRSHHGSNHMGCPKIGLPRNHQFGWDYMIIPDKPSSVFGDQPPCVATQRWDFCRSLCWARASALGTASLQAAGRRGWGLEIQVLQHILAKLIRKLSRVSGRYRSW